MRKSLLLAGLVPVLAVGTLAACEPNVNEDNVRHEYTDLTDNTWYMADTRVGGGVVLTAASDGATGISGPEGYGTGSLALTTIDDAGAKAQLLTNRFAGTNLGDLERISYQTLQDSRHTGFAQGVPAINMTLDTNGGAAGGFTTLVYEPYNTPGNVVTNETWQEWQPTDPGENWASSQTINVDCTTTPGGNPAGEPFESPAMIAARCPDAVIGAFGVNVGSSNPGYVTAVDDVELDRTVDGSIQTRTFDFGPKGSGSDQN